MTTPEVNSPAHYPRYEHLGYIAVHNLAPFVISPDGEREGFNARSLFRYRKYEYARFNPNVSDYEWAFDETKRAFADNVDSLYALANFIAVKNETPAVERDDIRKVARVSVVDLETAIAESKFWISRSQAQKYRPANIDTGAFTWWSSYPVAQMAGGLYRLFAKLHNTHTRLDSVQEDAPGYRARQAMFEEWYAYTALVNSILPDAWSRKFDCRTLSNYSVSELLARLDEKKLPQEQVISTFANRTFEFTREYQWLVRNKEQRENARDIGQSEKAHTARAKKLLAVDQYKQFAANQSHGTTLEVEKLEYVNDALFAVCAQQLTDAATVYGDAECNAWGNGVARDIASALRPKHFHGRLSNIRMVKLPFDEESMEKYLEPFIYNEDIDRETVTRVGVVADMYSTGRGKIGETFQDIIIFTENSAHPDKRKVKMSVRGAASGDKVMQYILRESFGRATLELIRGMSHPLSGGLPTLGRKR